MKKIVLSAFVSLILTSCGGYETLRTPFTFRGDEDAADKLHISEGGKFSTGPTTMDGFEVEVKAPAGTPMETAYSIFDKEARRLCNGDTYQYQILSQDITASSMPADRADKGNTKYHYLTGVAVCGVAKTQQQQNTKTVDVSDELSREGNTVSGTLRGRNYRGADIRGSSIPGRTINNTTPSGVSQQDINAVLNPTPVEMKNMQ